MNGKEAIAGVELRVRETLHPQTDTAAELTSRTLTPAAGGAVQAKPRLQCLSICLKPKYHLLMSCPSLFISISATLTASTSCLSMTRFCLQRTAASKFFTSANQQESAVKTALSSLQHSFIHPWLPVHGSGNTLELIQPVPAEHSQGSTVNEY